MAARRSDMAKTREALLVSEYLPPPNKDESKQNKSDKRLLGSPK